jgi:NAD(P)-dependent dehydrogenase (short-subunit alcohol dehydrogenase family)
MRKQSLPQGGTQEAQGIALQLDAGNVGSFDAFVESVKDALAKLGGTCFDFLVNNAGNNHRIMPFEKATEEEFEQRLQRPFQRGVLSDAKASAPHL